MKQKIFKNIDLIDSWIKEQENNKFEIKKLNVQFNSITDEYILFYEEDGIRKQLCENCCRKCNEVLEECFVEYNKSALFGITGNQDLQHIYDHVNFGGSSVEWPPWRGPSDLY